MCLATIVEPLRGLLRVYVTWSRNKNWDNAFYTRILLLWHQS